MISRKCSGWQGIIVNFSLVFSFAQKTGGNVVFICWDRMCPLRKALDMCGRGSGNIDTKTSIKKLKSKVVSTIFRTAKFADTGRNEVNRQRRYPQKRPPGASYTSCCPIGYRPHGAAWHRPASGQSCHPGSFLLF